MIEVGSRRLELRPVGAVDLAEFHQLHSGGGHRRDDDHPDLAFSASVIASIAADWERDSLGYWSVRLNNLQHRTVEFVGVAGVRRAGYTALDGSYQGDGDWNVYYRVSKAVRGRGYAGAVIAEAAARLRPAAVLSARIHPDNAPSRRVAEKLGMTLVHTGRDVAGRPELLYQANAATVSQRRSSERSQQG